MTTPQKSQYSKRLDQKATVGEARQLSAPAVVAARFALTVSFLALVVAAIALAVTLVRHP